MKLTPREFDARLKAGTLSLIFVGMSNIGKSFTASKIARDCGFDHIELDELIQNALALPDMAALADWLGFPFNANYAQHAAQYVALEGKLASQHAGARGQNLILDVTGSVIYCDEDTLERLKTDALIVHIAASRDDLDMLKSRFESDPKPLIWGRNNPFQGVQSLAELMQFYPRLLRNRARAYEKLADITLPAKCFRDLDSGNAVLDRLRAAL